MTIQELVKYATSELSPIYGENEAQAISEWLAEHLSGLRRTERIQLPKKELSPEQLSGLPLYLSRLKAQEPIQYVLQEAWFCGLKFYVDKHVLIPRPETEELVEWIISNCRFPIDEISIADIGTGSGCIPIALKKRLGKALVHGYDISAEALQVARQNANELGIAVDFHQLDFLHAPARATLPAFDIIVSNPPYIPESGKADMQPNVTEYEPHLALFVPDSDPLLFYRALADFGKQHLQKSGSMFMEIHEDLGASCLQLFLDQGYTAQLKKDMQGKERMIRAWL